MFQTMKNLYEDFDGIQVLISKDVTNLSGLNQDLKLEDSKLGYITTAAKGDIVEKVVGLRDVIAGICKSFHQKIEALGQYAPNEVQIELSVGFENSIGVWTIGTKGTFSTNIKLVWKKDELSKNT